MQRFSKEQYKEYIQSEEWRHKRQMIAYIHHYKCAKCGKICTDKFNLNGFEVHHKTYANFMHEKVSDLTFLCQRCHRIIHKFKYQKQKLQK